MNRLDHTALVHASRSAIACNPNDRPAPALRVAAAALPAAGILIACALMLSAIF